MADTTRIDQILTFALAVAGQEDFGNRHLGPIHLVKHVYLADLAHADRHGGATYTGTRWRFHHFGPWAVEVFNRIEPVVQETGAEERRFQSRFTDDFVRWTLSDEKLAERLDDALPLEVSRAVRNAVHQFGTDTSGLLHDVYVTRPMLRAAPGEDLDFSLDPDEPERPATASELVPQPLSKRQRSARTAQLAALRERVQTELAKRREFAANVKTARPPRYDDVFVEGVQELDRLAGEDLQPIEGTLEIADDIWKSRGRRAGHLP